MKPLNTAAIFLFVSISIITIAIIITTIARSTVNNKQNVQETKSDTLVNDVNVGYLLIKYVMHVRLVE